MHSAPQEEKGTHVVTIHPNTHILAAFPYGPHSSLLDFLRGEPKVLGAVQILLALITVSLGIIFTVNSNLLAKKFPLVWFAGYPFWGPIIFTVTGYLTIMEKASKNKSGRPVTTMNTISSLAAGAGIILTIISFTQQHEICQKPSLDGTCVIGRTLLLGLLSILLIISIVEFSICVTITSFRSKCWTQSDKVMFFLPSDAPKNSEQPAPEENTQLQSDLQKESFSFDMPPCTKTVFFGGYTFFKLRYSRSPLTTQDRLQQSRERAEPFPNEEQKNAALHVKSPYGNIELKSLPSTSEARSPENVHIHHVSTTEKLKDEDLEYAIEHTPKEQAQAFQDQDLTLGAFPPPSAESPRVLPVEVLPAKPLLMQASPVQDMPSKSASSPVKQSSDLIYKDSTSKDKQSQEKPSQAVPTQGMLHEASTVLPVKFASMEHPLQPSPDLKEQNVQQFSKVMYQDILTEIMELTQEWNSKEKLYDVKSPRTFSSNHRNQEGQSSKRHSLGLPTKDGKSPRRKSLDQKIRALLVTKRHPVDKKSQYTQTSEQFLDQQTEDWQAEGEQIPKQQSKDGEDKDQWAEKEQSPKKQTHGQQAAEEKSPKGWSENWPAEGPQAQMENVPKQPHQDSQYYGKHPPPHWSTPDSHPFVQQSQDWRSQGWRNEDWKAQERQFEMQHRLNGGSQDLFEEEALKQKTLYQEVQTQNTTARHNLGWQLQDKQCQDKDQDFQSRVMLKNATQIVGVKRDADPGDMNYSGQKPTDTQSEDTEPDNHPSSSQSVVQDTYLTCLPNMDSEQEVQQNTSVCSGSIKDDLNVHSTSCSLKDDQQQSEDSD